ncbi:MAG: hypothetical protein K2N34_01115, partial [Lachnospiraceae bacterium]|nr:hypothetical protein [Lachnospiraceae bacterium]
LMYNAGIKTYVELLIKIYRRIYNDGSEYVKAEREKGNFTKMLKGERELNSKYIVPLEQIFGIKIADILSDDKLVRPTFHNSGLRYTAATNDYRAFEELSVEVLDGDNLVMFNTDEFNKSIFDYIIEYRADNGIRFLVDKYALHYECLRSQLISPNASYCFCYGDNIERIADLLFETDDGETFSKIFYAYDILARYYDDGRHIYSNVSFLNRVLNSTNIFNAYLSRKEYLISEMNHVTRDDDSVGIVINPILNMILELAFDDPKKYADKILSILDYGIENNPDVISAAAHYDESSVHDFTIKENGNIEMNRIVCGSVIVIKDDYINLDITPEMRYKMAQIKEINNQILVRDTYEIFGAKRVQKNKSGNVIKRHTDNQIEYEMYSNLKNKGLPIPELLDTRDGIDEFSAYIGVNALARYPDEMIENAVEFIKKLHEISATMLDGMVYVHGNLTETNLYFSESNLTSVTNWDNCRIGDVEEDLAGLILNFSGVEDKFRDNSEVFAIITLILETYQADKNVRKQVVSYIREFIANSVAKLDLSCEHDIEEYETLKWCETFFDVYAKSIMEVQE